MEQQIIDSTVYIPRYFWMVKGESCRKEKAAVVEEGVVEGEV